MWLYTRAGFFSVVRVHPALEMAKEYDTGEDYLMIRARVERHLEYLYEANPDLISGSIVVTPNADYPYRVFIAAEAWKKLAARLAEEINYPNFKGEIEKHTVHFETGYLQLLHTVWEKTRDYLGCARIEDDDNESLWDII